MLDFSAVKRPNVLKGRYLGAAFLVSGTFLIHRDHPVADNFIDFMHVMGEKNRVTKRAVSNVL